MPRENREESNRDNRAAGSAPATNVPNAANASNPSTSASDRERSIQTDRESGRASSTGVSRGRGRGFERGGSPVAVMRRMARDMDQLFEQFGFGPTGLGLTPAFGSILENDGWGREGLATTGQALWSPEIEMFRRGDDLVVRADVPGVNRDDIHVDIENDVLTISGERREQHEENRQGVYRSERSYGQFHRAIGLPEGVDADACEASFKDGVLEVTVPAPKHEEHKAKRVPVR